MNKLISLASITQAGSEVDADALFDSLDLNADGTISIVELESVLGTDSKDFLKHLDSIQQDGQVSRDEFKRWADSKGSEFNLLNEQIGRINLEASKGTFHLYSMVADKLDKARSSK
jgi:Ca2+-binding EF-hand superfamily protein